MNKKGQDLSIGTLILIVLGIVVLVLLILGFSMGWGNLWEKINIFQGGSSVESVIQSCKIAASSNSVYTYCSDFKQIKIENKKQWVNCDFSSVKSQLDTKLTCTGNEAKAKCQSLKDAESDKTKFDDTIRVNGQTCASLGVVKLTEAQAILFNAAVERCTKSKGLPPNQGLGGVMVLKSECDQNTHKIDTSPQEDLNLGRQAVDINRDPYICCVPKE